MKRAAAIALALLAALAGCASTPQASPERDAEAKRFITQPGTAALYVYRNDFPSAISADSVLYVNNRLIGATLPGTFFRVELRPGTHVLYGIGNDQGRLKLEIRSTEPHFVALNVVGDQSYFRQVSAEAGKRELLRCCVLLENWAPGQRPLFR